LAAELAGLKLDVLVAVGPPGVLAAKNEASRVAVVFAAITDPVRNGLVASLARPGGNMTGVAYDPTPELSGKMVELCKQLLPKLSRLAVLWHSANPVAEQFFEEIRRAASSFQVTVPGTCPTGPGPAHWEAPACGVPGASTRTPSGMKFCGECAAPLAVTCPSCGAANPPENKFCGQCAAPVRTTPTAKFTAPDSYTPKHLAEKILTSKAALEE
jgi:hypothetical protein